MSEKKDIINPIYSGCSLDGDAENKLILGITGFPYGCWNEGFMDEKYLKKYIIRKEKVIGLEKIKDNITKIFIEGIGEVIVSFNIHEVKNFVF